MLKKSAALILSFLIALNFSACGAKSKQEAPPKPDKVQVSVTFDAMKEFVAAVGGDKVEITKIIPDGVEPHDFEPKAKDLAQLETAGVFVYNGLGMESWVDDAVRAVRNKNLILVDASDGTQPISNTDPGEIQTHGQYDPHIWLSLKGAEIESTNIKNALVQADPDNKAYYEENCRDFIAQLEKLYAEYGAKFHSVKKKSFVTGHAAFSYLCRDFGLQQNSVEDVFAEGEPSAQQLTKLVNYCKENDVTTIFAEEAASPAVSQTLAKEVGAKVETIYTMESGEDNKTYLERMEYNLEKISESLQ